MKTITIRGVDPNLDAKLKAEASKRGTSVNQLILEMIKNGLGLQHRPRFSREYDDLDDLLGRWSEEEYTAIQGRIDQGRKIDPELWP